MSNFTMLFLTGYFSLVLLTGNDSKYCHLGIKVTTQEKIKIMGIGQQTLNAYGGPEALPGSGATKVRRKQCPPEVIHP